jgi:hypothetical protein
MIYIEKSSGGICRHKKSQKENSFWLFEKIGKYTDYLFEN